MSFSTVKSAAMEGLAVEMVYVEADVSNGLPIFHMVERSWQTQSQSRIYA